MQHADTVKLMTVFYNLSLNKTVYSIMLQSSVKMNRSGEKELMLKFDMFGCRFLGNNNLVEGWDGERGFHHGNDCQR